MLGEERYSICTSKSIFVVCFLYAEINALKGDNLDPIVSQFAYRILNIDKTNCSGIKPKMQPMSVEKPNVNLEEREAKSPSDKTCCRIS